MYFVLFAILGTNLLLLWLLQADHSIAGFLQIYIIGMMQCRENTCLFFYSLAA